MQHTAGIELSHDDIDDVGFYNTQARERLSTVRQGALKQTSYSSFWGSKLLLSTKLEATVGARYDYFDTNVTNRA
ncbi:hypothetical protein [Pseudoalteromonas distincta]|uniref:hypothetical protein n=1 Tax=Pseudoalteromonas distincta TaxID=77608 RepID=UPI0039E732FC